MAETEELSLVVDSIGIIAPSSKDSSPEHQHSNDTANFSLADQQEQLSPSTSYETPDDEEPQSTIVNHRNEKENPTNGNESAESEESDNDEKQDAAKNSGEHSESETQNNSESASNQSKKENSESQNMSPEKQPNSESTKPDIDRDSRNPAFVPRSGRFFEHDDRNADVEAEEQPIVESPSTQSEAKGRDPVRQNPTSRPTSVVRPTETASRRSRADADSRWSHDLFNPKQQAPKSSRELHVRYGHYDVRRQRTGGAETEKTRRLGEADEREGAPHQSSERDTNGDRVRHVQSKRRPENSANRTERERHPNPSRHEAERGEERSVPDGRKTSRRTADDEADERLAYDDATQSDASDERASESESESDAPSSTKARPRNGDADVDTKGGAPPRNAAPAREELPATRVSKRQTNPGEFEPRANSRFTDEVRVIRSRRTANEDDADGRPARSARGRPNYGYGYNYNYGYYDYEYDEYAYSYDYYFDDYPDRDRSYTNGVRAPSGRPRNEPNTNRTRYTNGAGSRRDRAYFDDYADDYAAPRTFSQTQPRRGPAELYYEDPGDSRAAPHGRAARPPPRSAYSARSNRSGIDADRWLHDRADQSNDLPAKSTSLRSSERPSQRDEAPRSRLQPTKRPPFDASDDTRPTSTSLPSASVVTSDQRNASQRGRVANEGSRSRANTDAPENERNGDANKVNTNGARRPNSNLNAPVDSHSRPNAVSANRNAVSASATPYQTVQPTYVSPSPSAPGVELVAPTVYDSQSTALGSAGFYAVAATPAPSTVTPTPGSVVTSEQLNVLFDAFSAATAQFAPDVSNQILQTVAHTLMMHGAPAPAPVDAQVTATGFTPPTAPEAYTAPPTGDALGLPVPVTVPVGAPPDSNILSLVSVPVPVTVPVIPGALLAPIGAAASPYSAPTQPPAAYPMAAPFSAAASPQPPVTIAQPQPNSVPQQRRVRVPLPIIDPNEVSNARRAESKQSHVVATATDSVSVAVRNDDR